ncbi:hypothetical protein AB0L41_23685 [Amycolatopsis mediterranei]|uniref:hypothetical protein n=1 Tax=Amycolatopsis mediterranei TaxID=33910 RepID=UPI003444E6AB
MFLARRIGLVLACGLLAVLGLLAVPAAQAQVTPPQPPPYTVRTTPADLSAVQDGDPLRISVAGLPAGATAKAYLCPADLRDALLKQVSGQWVPNGDLTARVSAYCGTDFGDTLTGAKAGLPVITPSRLRSATTGEIVFDTPVPRGSSTPTYVGMDPDYTSSDPTETRPWPNNPVTATDPATGVKIRTRQWSYLCDETHPCRVMLTITAKNAEGKSVTWTVGALPAFAPTAPDLTVKGCAGLGANTLNASMPQRAGRSAVAWNQVLCAPAKTEQPTNIVSENEDDALTSFDTGASDLALTGSGSALATQTVRARQYVPVGINATVLAAVGWSPTDKADNGKSLKSKLGDTFSVTLDELATMLTKGGQNPDSDGRGGVFKDGTPLVTRNPALAAVTGQTFVLNPNARAGTLDSASGFFGFTGEAGKGTVPLALSSVLAKDAAGSWMFRKMGDKYYGDLDGKSPGRITDLNQLDPGQNRLDNVDAKVGQSAVRKVVDGVTVGKDEAVCQNGCLNWVVTDLATARAYGWTPVALPDGNGGFAAPTERSLQAAADSMTEGADGTLQPGTAAPGTYPLTFVEYLAVPVNPLIDADCRPLKAKQDALVKFTKMVQTRGQAALAPGLAPLTPALAGAALDRTDQIGTGTPEKACQEKEDAKNPPPPGTGTPGAATTASGGGTVTMTGTGATPMTEQAPAHDAVPTPQSVQAAKNVADVVHIPSFAGAGVLGALIPLLALVVLAVLPSATALATAGRPAPPWLTRLAEALVGLVARIRS